MSGSVSRRGLAVLLIAAAGWGAARAETPVSPQAQALERRLDALDVVHRWPAGVHVDWRTGLPDDVSERLPGRHTHCSAFLAAAADRLGIYVLRPPEHGQVLLANAQNEWFAEQGAALEWRSLPDMEAAQDAANRGDFVVASYRSRDAHRPGHIAIVLPGTKSAEVLADEGPDVMQAGSLNSARIPLREGFSGHPGAFSQGRILFYAHAVER